MKRWTRAWAVAATLAATSPVLAQEAPEPVADGDAFHIALPDGAVLTRRVVIDFAVYDVSVDGRPVAGFYEGFAADVDDWVSDRRSGQRQEHAGDNGGAEFFWSRSCMPTEVHGWIFPNLSAEDASRARTVVESLQMRPCD
jgi:hypothetical protein